MRVTEVQVNARELLVFDGTVLELFGFGNEAHRFHIRQEPTIDFVPASKGGLFTSSITHGPQLRVGAKGSGGFTFDLDEVRRTEVEQLILHLAEASAARASE